MLAGRAVATHIAAIEKELRVRLNAYVVLMTNELIINIVGYCSTSW